MKKNLLLFCCLLLLFSSISSYSQVKDSINFQIQGVPILKQKDDMACWITVTTMMLSWKHHKNYTTDEIAKKLGYPWLLYYETATGLPANEQSNFTKKIGLKAEPPANYMLIAYYEFLKKYGPLWIITGNDFGAHARLITGIEGDGSYNHSYFIIIDPLTGISEKQNAMDFMNEFEEEAKIANRDSWDELRIQIYHF